MVKEEPTRTVIKRLKAASFELVSTDGRHSKYRHQASGVSIAVPDSHRTISPGVVRKVNQAIEDSKKREGRK